MKIALFSLFLSVSVSAATISLSPSTPRAGDSVVVTIHDTGSLCPTYVVSSKVSGQTLIVDAVANPASCAFACPAVAVPVTFTAPAATLPAALPYSVEYAVTDCSGKRNVVATKPVLVRPASGCAFDRSLTVTKTTSGTLAFSWCDPSFSPFPDFGESVTSYRAYLVKEGEAPILVAEQSSGTTANVKLTDREAGATSAFVEASLCNVTIAGCGGTASILKSNVVPIDVAPADGCSFGGAALCLGGRFSVTARYHTASGSSPATPVPMTPESGYFWFFGPNNAEVTVKVVDACSFNSRFWIFAAGMTDVGVDLTVLDTKSGIVKRYSAPAGKPFQPILDTDAFATCQ